MQIECKKIKLRKWTVSICGVTDAKGFAELCCADSKEDKPNFEAIKCSKSTRVYRFEWAGKMWFFKEFRYRNPLKQLRVLNRGNHLYRMAHALNRNGFETPDIVCHARKGMRTFVVSEEANADDSVYNYLMEKSEITLSDLQRFRFLFGQEIGRLHGAGFVHGDLRWGNVLVRDAQMAQPVFIYIDNDRTRQYRQIPERERIKNLVQIKYPGSLLDKPESDWDAMWKGYVAGNPDVRQSAEVWRLKVDSKNERRVAAWWKKPRNRHLLEQRKQAEGAKNEA